MSKTVASLFACALAAVTMSCAVQSDPGADETAADEAALTAARSTYYTVRQDMRKCAWPACGGVWIKRVNFATTTCADGSHAAECYVTAVDLAKSGLAEGEVSPIPLEQRVYRGTMGYTTISGRSVATFKASEVWSAANDTAPTGTFYAVSDNGIRCIKAPCPTLDAAKLNSSAAIVKLNGMTGAVADKAGSVVMSGTPILGAGDLDKKTSNLALSQFYRRVNHDPMFCEADDQCTPTAYKTFVASKADCYCAICPSSVMSVTSATANYDSWQAKCSGTGMICPAVKCVMPRPVACIANQCQFVDR